MIFMSHITISSVALQQHSGGTGWLKNELKHKIKGL